MNIAFDIDGTLVDTLGFVESRKELFNKITGLECKFTTSSNEIVQFETEQIRNLFWKLFFDEYSSIKLDANTVKAINSLYVKGHKIYFISKRGDTGWGHDNEEEFIMEFILKRWLKDNGVCFDSVICTHGKSKSAWIQDLHIKYMVEDSDIELKNIPLCKLFLVDRKYNKSITGRKRVKSIYDFAGKLLGGYI